MNRSEKNLMLANFYLPDGEWMALSGGGVRSKKHGDFHPGPGVLSKIQMKLQLEHNILIKHTKDGWTASDFKDTGKAAMTGNDTYPSLEACLVQVVRRLVCSGQ